MALPSAAWRRAIRCSWPAFAPASHSPESGCYSRWLGCGRRLARAGLEWPGRCWDFCFGAAQPSCGKRRAENRIAEAASGEGRGDLEGTKSIRGVPRTGVVVAGRGNRRARNADRAGKSAAAGRDYRRRCDRNAADRRAVGGALGSQRGKNWTDHECGNSRRSFSEDRHARKLLRRDSAWFLRHFDHRPRFFADLHQAAVETRGKRHLQFETAERSAGGQRTLEPYSLDCFLFFESRPPRASTRGSNIRRRAMKYLAIIFAGALAAGAAAAQTSKEYSACSAKANTQMAMNACASAEATREDKELNSVYVEVLLKASGKPEYAEKVKAAEPA